MLTPIANVSVANNSWERGREEEREEEKGEKEREGERRREGGREEEKEGGRDSQIWASSDACGWKVEWITNFD